MLCRIISVILMSLCVFDRYITCMFDEPKTCYNRFEYEYNVIEKLVALSDKVTKQEEYIKSLSEQLKGAETTIRDLNQSLVTKELAADGSSYVRWGRTTCPDGASIVYRGLAAGGHFTHGGSGTNRLCLPSEPTWGDYIDGFNTADRLYGAEYETSYSTLAHLYDNDVPCAVCRIPRSDILMLPGRNICYDNYVLEYSGYLMAGHYSHAGGSDYVCVDSQAEVIHGGSASVDGNLFYFVEATCHILKCPPFVSGRELTCAVCSYSPKS